MAIATRIAPISASTNRLLHRLVAGFMTIGLVLGLAACDDTRPLGAQLDEGAFGNPTMNNILLQNGDITYSQVLNDRFRQMVPTTINFAFNSAVLDAEAQAVLREQAAFIKHFPEVRFTVYGHTDLVGSASYNYQLGLRRARAAMEFIVAQGVDRSRLRALVSRGETEPVVPTQMEERRNRRTVTEVSGFVQTHPLVLDGQYAAIVFRSYVGSAGE